MYTPVVREEQHSAIHAVNAIDPVYIETAGKIIEAAEKSSHHGDILLPLADHLAFAARRERIYFFRIRLYRILRFYLEKSMR